LLVITPAEYFQQFVNYREMLATDADFAHGMGVWAILHSWFSLDVPKLLVTGAGIVIFLLPFARLQMYRESQFRLMALASILLWCVIFNHRSESPTFIIAVAGVSIWYFLRKRGWAELVLGLLVIVFTSLSPTDLVPSWFYYEWVLPFALKGAFCVVVWFRLIYEMLALPSTVSTPVGN
jgi:hypothetical protein